jgi:hypothetical protein
MFTASGIERPTLQAHSGKSDKCLRSSCERSSAKLRLRRQGRTIERAEFGSEIGRGTVWPKAKRTYHERASLTPDNDIIEHSDIDHVRDITTARSDQRDCKYVQKLKFDVL